MDAVSKFETTKGRKARLKLKVLSYGTHFQIFQDDAPVFGRLVSDGGGFGARGCEFAF